MIAKKMLVLISLVASCGATYTAAEPVSEWYLVAERNGSAELKLYMASGSPKEISKEAGEYPLSYSFPTNDMLYWKKQGSDWVEMDAGEKAVVDASSQEAVTARVTEDAIDDAFIAAIAKAIKQNAKTYDEVKALFKESVNPKKADKKKKEKK